MNRWGHGNGPFRQVTLCRRFDRPRGRGREGTALAEPTSTTCSRCSVGGRMRTATQTGREAEETDVMADTCPTGTGTWTLRRAATNPAAPPPAPARLFRAPGAEPQQWHRGMTLVATISLFIGTRAAWTNAMASRPAVAGVI